MLNKQQHTASIGKRIPTKSIQAPLHYVYNQNFTIQLILRVNLGEHCFDSGFFNIQVYLNYSLHEENLKDSLTASQPKNCSKKHKFSPIATLLQKVNCSIKKFFLEMKFNQIYMYYIPIFRAIFRATNVHPSLKKKSPIICRPSPGISTASLSHCYPHLDPNH